VLQCAFRQNPFEESSVEFITNYVDLGVETTVTSTGTKMAVGAVTHTPHTQAQALDAASAPRGL
jgi:hypothetical protein